MNTVKGYEVSTEVVIRKVGCKKELKEWVRFPSKLYGDNEYFVPFLEIDEIDTFTKSKNPAYEFCETELFLAYKNGEAVGRIAVLINHAYNRKWNKNAIRFTRFDFIDDYNVSEALFAQVERIARERGFTEAMGPIGFTDMDHEGMLVEGFDEFNMSITFYNHPYYLDHMERLGLRKDIDWIENRISVPEKMDEHMERLSAHILEKHGLKVVKYDDRRTLKQDALEAFKIIDIAFSRLYGTVPLTPKIIEKAVSDYVPLVHLDYICSIKDSKDKIIGFAVMVPSIAKALKRSNGRLLPFGIFRMLKALKCKNDVLEMFFVAVEPEYQLCGVPAIMISSLLPACIKNGVKYCETGPQLETNGAVHSMWKHFESRQHRRRRCYIKAL